MKKKILLSSLFCMMLLLCLVSCFTSSITQLELVGDVKTEYEIGDKLDLEAITLRATQNDGKTFEVKASNSAVTVTGFDTNSAGRKTMVFRYDGISLSVAYTVFSAGTTANTTAELKDLISKQVGTIRLAKGVFEGLDVTVSYPVKIVSDGEAQVVEPIVKADTTGSVVFENIKFKDTVKFQGEVSFSGCEFTVEGKKYGLQATRKATLTVEESKFVTEKETDCFDYLIACNASDTKVIIKDTTISCNFFYGVSAGYYLYMDNCTVNSTLKADTPLKDTYGAPIYNAKKNPVAIHANAKADAITNEWKFNYTVKNSTFSNVQNVMRVYELDQAKDENVQLVWVNNTIDSSCNFVVNFSSKTYGTMPKILNALGLKDSSKFRYVISQNTEIVKKADEEITVVKNGNAYQYTGLQYKDKNDASIVYDYVGFDGSSHILLKDGKYYSIKIAYSSDGLDTRTIVELAGKPALFK